MNKGILQTIRFTYIIYIVILHYQGLSHLVHLHIIHLHKIHLHLFPVSDSFTPDQTLTSNSFFLHSNSLSLSPLPVSGTVHHVDIKLLQ